MLDPRVRRLLGAANQLFSATRVVLDDGPGRGSPAVVVRNPGGISFDVLVGRAMDIGWADAVGVPLAWRSPQGYVDGARFEPRGDGWKRSFGGGLLTTCGLASTGAASTIGKVHYPLHGRVGHIPAENVRLALVDDGGPALEIVGDVVEAALGQPALTLRRQIVASTGEPRLRVTDTVRNAGWQVAGHMFRHHLNLGAPVVVPGTVVTSDVELVGERDQPAGGPVALPWELEFSVDGVAPERVVYGRAATGPVATTTIRSPEGVWIAVEQETATWDRLVLWRDASAGVNVLGVEPSMSGDGGRAQAEHDGEVTWLAPGQEITYTTVVRAGRA